MSKSYKITIIGAGNVAWHLSQALEDAGHSIQEVYSRNHSNAKKLCAKLYDAYPSEDLDFVVTALNVQREVGGNLAEILDTISFTIRERVRIKGEIRIMTAQVRTSGAVLSLIPVFLGIALWFISPEYIGTFFHASPSTPQPLCGIIAVGTIVGMIVAGYFVMQKIADIEV